MMRGCVALCFLPNTVCILLSSSIERSTHKSVPNGCLI